MKAFFLIFSFSLLFISCTTTNKKAENPDHQCLVDKDYKGCQAKLNYFYRYNNLKEFKLLWSKVCTKNSFRAKCDSKVIMNRDVANKLPVKKNQKVYKFSTDTAAVRLFYIRN